MTLLKTFPPFERRILPGIAQDLIVVIPGCAFLAHFFISIGRDEVFWEMWSTSWYLKDLLFVWGISLAVILPLRSALFWLERDHPWADGRVRRLLLQSLLCVFLPTALAVVLVWAYLIGIHDQQLVEGTFFSVELPVTMLAIGLVNISYMYWLQSRSPVAPIVVPDVPEPPTLPRTLVLTSGKRNVVVPVETVRWVTKEGELAMVHVADGSSYVCTESLDSLQEKLGSEELFFRANRQNIVHRLSCGSFRSHRSGQIELTLVHADGTELAISQKRAPAFRTWLKQGA
jgi:hypothetical protein